MFASEKNLHTKLTAMRISQNLLIFEYALRQNICLKKVLELAQTFF